MRNFFLITLLFFYSNSIFCNYDMNANMQLAYSQIINLNFDDAIDILENEKIQNLMIKSKNSNNSNNIHWNERSSWRRD